MLFNLALFNTELGWVAVVGSLTGICRTTLPAPDKMSAINVIMSYKKGSSEPASIFNEVAERIHTCVESLIFCEQAAMKYSLSEVKNALTGYFEGKRVEFPFPVDLEGYTCFQRNVWKATQSIPYGQLRSYRWVSDQIGKPGSARAVGQALGNNPLPVIVPCHRVVCSDGNLGGFSGGLHWKRKLIELEKAVI